VDSRWYALRSYPHNGHFFLNAVNIDVPTHLTIACAIKWLTGRLVGSVKCIGYAHIRSRCCSSDLRYISPCVSHLIADVSSSIFCCGRARGAFYGLLRCMGRRMGLSHPIIDYVVVESTSIAPSLSSTTVRPTGTSPKNGGFRGVLHPRDLFRSIVDATDSMDCALCR
jgi:hypothetical protein